MEESLFIPCLQRSLTETLSQKEQLLEFSDEAIEDIERRAEFLHAMIDELKEECRKRVISTRKEELKRLSDHENEIRELINHLNKRNAEITKCTKCRSRSLNGISLCSPCEDEISKIQKLSEFEHICLHFKPTTVTKTDMSPLYGSVENYHITRPSTITKEPPTRSPKYAVKLISQFTCSDPCANVHAILPVSDSEAWVCCGWGSKDIHLYNTSGVKKVSLTLDVQVDHMCLISSGDILISSYNGTVIQRVDENLHISSFAVLEFFPRGMFVTASDEIYVCGTKKLCNSMTQNIAKRKNRHLIVKMSKRGEILSEVDVSPHDPHRIAIDDDGNMFFSDYGIDKRRQFVVMRNDGKVKVIYTGPFEKLDNPFYPLGVCRDRFGNFLISDWNNDEIHLLNKDGHFLRFLLTTEHGIECPNALALDREDQLWVGDGVGRIKVFRYVL